MNVVLDTSVVIALLASDEERDTLVKSLDGYNFVCSESISPEMGNAVSAMFKRGRITLAQGHAMIEGFQQLPIQLIALNFTRALEISHAYHIYAYDAYVLECAERLHAELITLDTRMQDIAQQLGIQVIKI